MVTPPDILVRLHRGHGDVPTPNLKRRVLSFNETAADSVDAILGTITGHSDVMMPAAVWPPHSDFLSDNRVNAYRVGHV